MMDIFIFKLLSFTLIKVKNLVLTNKLAIVFFVFFLIHSKIVGQNLNNQTMSCNLSYEQIFCPKDPFNIVSDLIPIPNQIFPYQWYANEYSLQPLDSNTEIQTRTYFAEIPGNTTIYEAGYFTNDLMLTNCTTQLSNQKILVATSVLNWFTLTLSNKIFIYNSDRTNKSLFTNVTGTVGSMLELNNNVVLITKIDEGQILKYTINGEYLGIFADNLGTNIKITKFGENEILVLSNSEILKYNYEGEFISVYLNNVDGIFSILEARNGDILLLDRNNANVLFYDRLGNFINSFSIDNFTAVDFVQLNNQNIVVAFRNGTVIEFSPDGTCKRTLQENISSPNSIDLIHDGRLLLTDQRASQINPAIGNVRTLIPKSSPNIRVPVNVVVHNVIPPIYYDKTVCYGSTFNDLTGNIENIKWYKQEIGGLAIDENDLVETGYYYIGRNYNGCESLYRRKVFINVINNLFALYDIPINVSGHNHDIVANNLPVLNTITRGFNPFGDFLISGEITGINNYLPTNKKIISEFTGIKYNLKNYDDLNVFSLFQNESLKIKFPSGINNNKLIHFLASSNQYTTFVPFIRGKILFSDGTFQEIRHLYIFNWNTNLFQSAIDNIGRFDFNLNNTSEIPTKLFDISLIISLENRNKEISSIDISFDGFNQESINILAISRSLDYLNDTLYVCEGQDINNLKDLSNNLLWYDSVNSVTPLDRNHILQNATYYLTSKIGNCESEKHPINIILNSQIPNPPYAVDQIFCDVTLVSDLIANGENIRWYSENNEEISLDLSDQVSSGHYYVTQTINGCESEKKKINIIVNNFNIPFIDDQIICYSPVTGVTINDVNVGIEMPQGDFEFNWYMNGNLIESSNQNTISISMPCTYFVEIKHLESNCIKRSNDFIVYSYYIPNSISYFVTKNFSIETITVVVQGSGNYLYQLDNGNFQEGNVFPNVLPGNHTITVKDLEGCTFEVIEVKVISFPNFFTPNGDGVNDTWNIWSLSDQQDAEIFIMDRYGKLIKQISPAGSGWDGTYNGTKVPSTDYWFVVKYRDGIQQEFKEFKSHFSLKR